MDAEINSLIKSGIYPMKNNYGEDIVHNCQYCKMGLSFRELAFMTHLCAEMPLMKAIDRQIEFQTMIAEVEGEAKWNEVKRSYKELRRARIIFWAWVVFLVIVYVAGSWK